MKVNGQEFDQNGRESSTFMQRFTLISVDVHLNLTIELDCREGWRVHRGARLPGLLRDLPAGQPGRLDRGNGLRRKHVYLQSKFT